MGAIWQPVNILHWCFFLWRVQRNKTGVTSEFTLVKYQPWQTKKENSVRRKKQLMARLLRPWDPPLSHKTPEKWHSRWPWKSRTWFWAQTYLSHVGLGELLNPCCNLGLTHCTSFKRYNLGKRQPSPEGFTLKNVFEPYTRGGRSESLSFLTRAGAAI